jgi:hypothetical protein
MLWDKDAVAVDIRTTAYGVTTGSTCERKDSGSFGVRVWQVSAEPERLQVLRSSASPT